MPIANRLGSTLYNKPHTLNPRGYPPAEEGKYDKEIAYYAINLFSGNYYYRGCNDERDLFMKGNEKRKSQAKTIRLYRKAHRTTGIFLFVFFFIVALTAILLGWKKHSAGILLPVTRQGTSTNFADWMPLEQLHTIAFEAIKDSLPSETKPVLDRIDIRKSNGILKFTFSNTYLEVQLDGASGEVLSIGQRRSDFIERLHDGSILDELFNTGNGQIKVVYTSILGLGLLLFTVSGFWLWYGPKRMKKTIRNHEESH